MRTIIRGITRNRRTCRIEGKHKEQKYRKWEEKNRRKRNGETEEMKKKEREDLDGEGERVMFFLEARW